MNTARAFLTAPRYVLGEIEEDHSKIENLYERARQFRMQPEPQLWGWGRFHRTECSLADLAISSGSETLRAAGLAPSSVDALILCSTRFPGGAETHGSFVETIMSGLRLDAAFLGVTLNRCANLLAAVRVAEALVAGGRYRRVLVITTDRVRDEASRLENFALFSDGAASCVISGGGTDEGDGYEIVASATTQDVRALGWSNEISSDLSRQVNSLLLEPLGMKAGDVDGVLNNNLFKPLLVLKERQAGFIPAQLYTDNVERVGHCFAADPLINLVDRARAGQLRDDGHYLLAASVPGCRVGVLLRAGNTRSSY